MPIVYGDQNIIQSHLFTRSSASVFDVSHMCQLEIRGADRLDFLESLVCGDIRGLGEARGCLSLILTDKGTIIDDTVITRNSDHIYMVINAGCADKDLAHFNGTLKQWKSKGKDVSIVNLSEQMSLVALQGPKAAEALAKATEGGANLDTVPFMGAFRTKVFGKDAYITRCGYTGEDGFELSVKHEDAVHVTDSLVGDGTLVKAAGLGARDTLRLEAGLCLYGNDLDETITPPEAGLNWTIGEARKSPDHPVKFPGQDIIMKQIADKSWTKKRVGIIVDSKRSIPHPADVMKDGKKVGSVTSGSLSPVLQKGSVFSFFMTFGFIKFSGIGMAYMDRPNHLKKTTGLYLEVRGKPMDISITSMPFVPTNYKN